MTIYEIDEMVEKIKLDDSLKAEIKALVRTVYRVGYDEGLNRANEVTRKTWYLLRSSIPGARQ